MYKTPEALQMAVRDAARNSPIETSRAIESFYYHRLLCRIFSRSDSKFVLKGGLGMLARTIDARATRDIDLATEGLEIEKAVVELKELASIDLGDFIVYRFDGMEPIRVEDEYRDGYKVFFTPVFGGRERARISIDLVANAVSYGEPDMLTPVDRVDVADLPVFDYLVYPVTSAIADKVCGIVGSYAGKPSSRVKDLVDLVIYITTEDFDYGTLSERLSRELKMRKLELGDCFRVPVSWHENYSDRYSALSRRTGMDGPLQALEAAETLVGKCLNPVLSRAEGEARWNHKKLDWIIRGSGLEAGESDSNSSTKGLTSPV